MKAKCTVINQRMYEASSWRKVKNNIVESVVIAPIFDIGYSIIINLKSKYFDIIAFSSSPDEEGVCIDYSTKRNPCHDKEEFMFTADISIKLPKADYHTSHTRGKDYIELIVLKRKKYESQDYKEVKIKQG